MSKVLVIKYWLPVFLWAGLIFGLSSIPSLNTGFGVWDYIFRKFAHAVEFAVLTFLLIRAMRKTWPDYRVLKLILWSFGVAVLYAFSDEWHQGFVPGRGPSALDIVFDSWGSVLMCVYCTLKLKFR